VPGQVWAFNALGGYWANPALSSELRFQSIPLMKLRQFVKPIEGYGANQGDKLDFDKISRVVDAGGELQEGNPIPETNFTTTRGTVTVKEYGNGIPYTGKLEALSQWNPEDPIQRVLRDDMALTLDKKAGTQFRSTQVVYAPTGTLGTPTGSFTYGYTGGEAGAPPVASTRNIATFDVKQIVDEMKRKNVPKYDGENYMCVSSILGLRGIKDDSAWVNAASYGDPERLFAGEVGRYYGCRFVEENNVLLETLTGTCGEQVYFGADPVVEGVAVPEELRYDIPQDAGRSKKIVWYALLGFQIVYLWSTDAETRIVRVWG
jgi:N4-gp56 family major capsid protein